MYKPLDADITPTIKAEIDCKLESLCLAGMIDKEMKEFCMPPRNHRTSRLYFLKIQKNPMGIRPIVSSCSSITENISEFVDMWLQPLKRDLPSFIKDSIQPHPTYLPISKICRVELCTELFYAIIPTFLCFLLICYPYILLHF